jgi:MFS family permease
MLKSPRSMFLLGMPFYVVFVQLPQRFQNVNFTTAERAGVLLLPTALVTAVGAMAAGLAIKKIHAEYILVGASALVCISTGLLGSLPTSSALSPSTYGYQVLAGLSLGAASPPYYMLLGTSISERDISVGTGALNMMRTLGGCVAVAICSAVHQEFLGNKLPLFLSPREIAAIGSLGSSMAHLPPATQERVGTVFGGSYNRQFLVMLAFTALNLVVTIVLTLVRWKKGILGLLSERKEGNEFMNAEEREIEKAAAGVSETPVT